MLTGVVLAKNEQAHIGACLSSLKFCDQLLLVDDFSTDDTAKISKSIGAKIISHKFSGDFAAQRNFALQHVTTPWALFLDADERVSPELGAEITANLKNPKYDAYFIPRQDYLWGKALNHGDPGNAFFVRLGKSSSHTWGGGVHAIWSPPGPVGKLQHPIIHYPHPTVADFIAHINTWSTYRAQELISQKINVSFAQVLFIPILKFFHLYLLKLGFLDGMPGLVSALIMSMYTFLVRGKVYLNSTGIGINE
jgi:glycosyltransferase involved in cell wall biosynthesis